MDYLLEKDDNACLKEGFIENKTWQIEKTQLIEFHENQLAKIYRIHKNF